MRKIPRDLADLLSTTHREIWEPKFRDFLETENDGPRLLNTLDLILDINNLDVLDAKVNKLVEIRL